MRIQLNYVNAYLVKQLIKNDVIADVTANGLDIIMIELLSGEKVSIHLVERDVDVDLIQKILRHNTELHVATLFILWCAMLLPENGDLYRPYDWMSALTTLYGDKIYAYETYGSDIYIFPVYFERQDAGVKRFIRYGQTVTMRDFGCETIRTQGQIPGTWRIADFEGDAAKRTKSQADSQAGAQNSKDREEQRYSRLRTDRNPIWVYYEVLGITLDADFDSVKKAYHQLARQYHPDVNKTPEATERMQQINTAYNTIIDSLGENPSGA